MDAHSRAELTCLINKLYGISDMVAENRLKFLEYAAVPVVDKSQSLAPKGVDIHYRYSTPKLIRSMRAPKGLGVKVAQYQPGNLSGAVRILKLQRAKVAVYVGPKITKSGKGSFGQGRYDAYYAHMVEFGTRHSAPRPFMRPAAKAAQGEVVRRVEVSVRILLRKYAKQNGLGT